MNVLIALVLISCLLFVWLSWFKASLIAWLVIGFLSLFFILYKDTGRLDTSELKPYRKNIKWILLGPLTLIYRFIVLPLCRFPHQK